MQGVVNVVYCCLFSRLIGGYPGLPIERCELTWFGNKQRSISSSKLCLVTLSLLVLKLVSLTIINLCWKLSRRNLWESLLSFHCSRIWKSHDVWSSRPPEICLGTNRPTGLRNLNRTQSVCTGESKLVFA